MKEIKVDVAVAFDGKEFYGETRKEECKAYENELRNNIEKEMIGNVIIFNKELFFGGMSACTYIHFLTEYGKTLFIKWGDTVPVKIDISELANIKLNKWYHVYDVFGDGYIYKISNTSLDDVLVNYNKLYHMLNDKAKHHINHEQVENIFITDLK